MANKFGFYKPEASIPKHSADEFEKLPKHKKHKGTKPLAVIGIAMLVGIAILSLFYRAAKEEN